MDSSRRHVPVTSPIRRIKEVGNLKMGAVPGISTRAKNKLCSVCVVCHMLFVMHVDGLEILRN